ncbi:MAG: YkgJ family cysteine cluster protein [Bacteriovorax sp.]|nr:YkgJ family cysteine cluster protein [Bacteriovorax sp.]
MFTSSSNLIRHKILGSRILVELNNVFEQFSAFQKKVELPCPSGCGKCCFKSDIYCAPIELLPMVLDMLERGEALSIYEKCGEFSADHCMFMEISDFNTGKGQCSEYQFRPLVCRTFGVAGRHDKNNNINYSVCTTLKEAHEGKYNQLISSTLVDDEVMFIDDSKSRLSNLDPAFLEQEYPINVALFIMLEKILFLVSLDSCPDNGNT